MDEIDAFIDRTTSKLLARITQSGDMINSTIQPLEFVDKVLDDWSEQFGSKELPEPTLRERAFWFTLYEYEELAENDLTGKTDPYLAVIRGNLAITCDVLRRRADLPDTFFATRPGEWDLDEDEDTSWLTLDNSRH